MPLADELLEIERRLWRNDPQLYHDTLDPDVMLVFPETGVITRDFAVKAIEQEVAENRVWADVQFSDVKVQSITGDVAALTYKVKARWNYETEGTQAIASSIYVRKGGAWRLALHQQGQLPAG